MTERPNPRTWALVAGGTFALAAAACGSTGADSSCGPITQETLDPAYLVHVVGDNAEERYATDPPTSGPHKTGATAGGVVDEPLSRPVQVGILERGDILLQHDLGLARPELADLEALAGPRVVVAPNSDLPTPIVATAWRFKRICTSVDVDALREFIRARAGKGPDG